MSEATEKLVVQGLEFEIPGVKLYAEGHQVTANEANVLNQIRRENVRNNVAGKIKAAAEKANVKPEDLDADSVMIGEGEEAVNLRQYVTDYFLSYEFGIRAVRTSEPVDPIEREAFRIAKETVRLALKQNNIKVKDLEEGQFENMVEQLSEDAEILAEAKRRVKANDKLGQLNLNLPGASNEAGA